MAFMQHQTSSAAKATAATVAAEAAAAAAEAEAEADHMKIQRFVDMIAKEMKMEKEKKKKLHKTSSAAKAPAATAAAEAAAADTADWEADMVTDTMKRQRFIDQVAKEMEEERKNNSNSSQSYDAPDDEVHIVHLDAEDVLRSSQGEDVSLIDSTDLVFKHAATQAKLKNMVETAQARGEVIPGYIWEVYKNPYLHFGTNITAAEYVAQQQASEEESQKKKKKMGGSRPRCPEWDPHRFKKNVT